MDNIVERLKSLIPSDQFQLIIGSLMGDARLECRSRSIRVKHTARLRIHQSDKQKEYVFWKYQILKNLVIREPRFTKVWYDKKRNKNHYSWYFHTVSSETFGSFHKLFYRNGTKVVPIKLLKELNPLGLAIWYMDDGSNNGGSITLNTHCFSEQEQIVIQNLLKNKFGVIATVVKDRNKLKIGIGSREYQKFIDLVRPYIPVSMNYKISSPRNDLLLNQQQAAVI